MPTEMNDKLWKNLTSDEFASLEVHYTRINNYLLSIVLVLLVATMIVWVMILA